MTYLRYTALYFKNFLEIGLLNYCSKHTNIRYLYKVALEYDTHDINSQ